MLVISSVADEQNLNLSLFNLGVFAAIIGKDKYVANLYIFSEMEENTESQLFLLPSTTHIISILKQSPQFQSLMYIVFVVCKRFYLDKCKIKLFGDH